MTRRPHRTALSAVAAVAALGLLAGCGGTASGSGGGSSAPLGRYVAPAGKPDPAWSRYTFTVGDNGGDGTQELAKLSGVFDSAPYTVKFARFTFGPPLIQATASGDIDLGAVGDVPPITGAAKTYGFKIVGVLRSLHPDQPVENILVPRGSTLRTLADLRGKRIAVPQGSSAHGLVLNALKSAGLGPDDVRLNFLSPAAGASAFASGKVDAWAIWNPQSALALSQGARVLAKGLPPIDQTSSYYVATDRSLRDPAKRAALTDVLERVAAEFAWARQNPDQYATAIATEEGISLADARSVLPTLEQRVTAVQPPDITAEQNLSDAFFAVGQISTKVDIPQIVDSVLPAGYDSSTLSID